MFIFNNIYNKTILFIGFFLAFFTINISINYANYLDLIYEETYKVDAQVLNIYKKEDYNVLKLKTKNFNFFTSIPKEIIISRLDFISILIITRNISFIDYLKGFYSNNINLEYKEIPTFKSDLSSKIKTLHNNPNISQIFNALFFAIPINTDIREVFTNYSISHLIALSGFHIALLSFIIYWVFYYPYKYIHQKYFPYRNRKSDLMILTIVVIFGYLVFTDFVASLLRAFIMVLVGFLILRSNLKLISYQTLAITFLIVVALFPSYLFSIGFWFSIIAVFYIFLYLQYFQNINKYIQILVFNFWIFFVFNPIVHFFFSQTSFEQLLSPFITIFFSIFYPFEIFAHLFNFSTLLDKYILDFISHEIFVFEVKTSIWFFVSFILVSLLSMKSKKAFYILNFLTLIFNIYLYNPKFI